MIDHGKCGQFPKVKLIYVYLKVNIYWFYLGDMIMKGEGHTDWV
jgi:hypothetical protein